jgi:transcriptional regulator with XRE-family HTH domain
MKPSDKLTLGQTLQAVRERAKLSTRQLSTISGVERSAIVRLEADKVDEPLPDNLVRLADALELNATDLFVKAGLPIPQELPSLAPYLRTKYDLPPEALAEAQKSLELILAKYDKDADQ